MKEPLESLKVRLDFLFLKLYLLIPLGYLLCREHLQVHTFLFQLPQFCHSLLELFLVALACFFHQSCGMPFVLCSTITKPADELALVFTEQVELLSMFLT